MSVPGRDHLSHRLVQRGLSDREGALVLYLAALCCGGIAVFVAYADPAEAYVAGTAVLLISTLFLVYLERSFPHAKEAQERTRSRDA
jgi:uncharacterized membrane protein YfcA